MLCVGGVAVYTRGLIQKLLILVGLSLAYVIYAILTNGMGLGTPINFAKISEAAWFGMPQFETPVFSLSAITLIAPVVIILVGENLGHIKAVTAMTGRNLDPYMGRAFLGDGLASGYEVSSVKTDPVKIEVAGPENILSKLTSIETQKISLDGLTKTTDENVQLAPTDGVTVTNNSVTVHIEIKAKKKAASGTASP